MAAAVAVASSASPRAWTRVLNAAVAAAFAAYLLVAYWPLVKLFDLSRADLMIEGDWIGGYAKQVTAVTPGGVADRAGIRAGDVLEFDPGQGRGLGAGRLSADAGRIQREPAGTPCRWLALLRSTSFLSGSTICRRSTTAWRCWHDWSPDHHDRARGLHGLGASEPDDVVAPAGVFLRVARSRHCCLLSCL